VPSVINPDIDALEVVEGKADNTINLFAIAHIAG
jgi:hypothetical protein